MSTNYCLSPLEADTGCWKSHCVDYNQLDRQANTIKNLRLANDERVSEEHARFKSIFDLELEKLNIFHSEAVAFFTGKVHLLDYRIGNIRKLHEHSQTRTSVLHSLQCDVLLCGKGLLNLEDFALSNYSSLQQALKRLDVALGFCEKDIHIRRVELGAFYTQTPPEHLCNKIERIYLNAASLESDTPSLSEDPETFMSDCFKSGHEFWRECRRITSLQDESNVVVNDEAPSFPSDEDTHTSTETNEKKVKRGDTWSFRFVENVSALFDHCRR